MADKKVAENSVDLAAEKERTDEWLDTALASSFPASDPLPMFHGEVEPSLREDSPAEEIRAVNMSQFK
jgi:hypothetical protein